MRRKRLPFLLLLFAQIGICLVAQQAGELTTTQEGAAAIKLPAGTWEFVYVSPNPEIVFPPGRSTIDAANPRGSVELRGQVPDYWVTVGVFWPDETGVPNAKVLYRRIEPEVPE